MKLVNGKRALVTGGGTGIGFGIARRLLEHGAYVLIVGRRADVLEEAVARLRQAVPEAALEQQVCDVTDEGQIEAAVKRAAGARGRLDLLVANAGSGFPGPITELTAEGWRYCCELNIIGSALCIKHAARAMQEHGGSIVTISSTSGVKVEKWMAPYSVTKAGLEMLTRCAAIELAPFQIRVNCIQPGFVETEATTAFLHPDLKRRCLEHTPLGGAGEPERIGDGVLYLASDMGKWVTGQVLGIDGGMNVPVGEDFEELARQIYGDACMNACVRGRTAGE
jgi:NAD(P)-dependent dehydrogenase (short-subunit alcohol dehydrogenase family)